MNKPCHGHDLSQKNLACYWAKEEITAEQKMKYLEFAHAMRSYNLSDIKRCIVQCLKQKQNCITWRSAGTHRVQHYVCLLFCFCVCRILNFLEICIHCATFMVSFDFERLIMKILVTSYVNCFMPDRVNNYSKNERNSFKMSRLENDFRWIRGSKLMQPVNHKRPLIGWLLQRQLSHL